MAKDESHRRKKTSGKDAAKARHVLDLCDIAIELPVDYRHTFLATVCAGDAELLDAAKALLKAIDDSGHFLELADDADSS